MPKLEEYSKYESGSQILPFKKATVIFGIFAIIIGIFFASISRNNAPVSLENAIVYSGSFEKYETSRNYCGIVFQDGTTYEVYPHTEKQEFRDAMNALVKGTKLYLLINPNNNYVAEVKTDTKELLNFESSQIDIDAYDDGYIWIGLFTSLCGVFLIVSSFLASTSARKEAKRKKERSQTGASMQLRRADTEVKSRILLEKNHSGYRICYRRVGITNELVVNGYVYDEKKAVLEFDHCLSAHINGHQIEAGLENEYSYIRFDTVKIGEKKRLI